MSIVRSRTNSPSTSLNLEREYPFFQSTLPVHSCLATHLRESGLATPPPEIITDYLLDSSNPRSTLPNAPVVACLGVGYVGLHLVTAFANRYTVIAYDPDIKRLEEITPDFAGRSIIPTSNPEDIAAATHFLIAVPTKLHQDNTIDTKHLRSAISLVEQYAQDGSTIVIESSVAVGMTRDLLKPLMTSRGFKGGMSPERVDPGRVSPRFEEIPKIVSGLDDITSGSRASIVNLYKLIFPNIVQVSKPEVAEMTKLYENCQRMVCLNYANEMADACHSLNIDPLEVSAAAATKPFGYQPYTPGLGVGGHCIPVNPYYLLSNASFPLLEQATQNMANRPAKIGDTIVARFLNSGRSINASRLRILVVGAGFKRGQSVLSNSPGIALMMHFLFNYEAHVEYVDPLVKQEALSFVPKMDEADWNPEILERRFDIIVVALDQMGLDMNVLRQVKDIAVENFTSSLPWGQVKSGT